MTRYAGGLAIMAWSESTGYVSFPRPRGWSGQTRQTRHVGRMKRQVARLITNSKYPPF